MEVELIDITEADQEEANCEEIVGLSSALGGTVKPLKNPTTESTAPCATTETTTEATEPTEMTVEAPAEAPAAPPSSLKSRG